MIDKSKKEKILRIISVALPIVLIAVLAVTLVLAFKLSNEISSLPAYNDISDQTTTSTQASTSTTAPKEDEKPIVEYFTQGLDYKSLGNGTCRVLGLGTATDTYIIIPKINEFGDLVIGIENGAFKNCNKIKGVEFPDTLLDIGSYAFYGSSVKEIEIGTKVDDIGSYAFSACRNLENIYVSEENAYYSSLGGVLYNKDKSELITYPAGKEDNTCVIPKEVEKIANMAFYYCSDIKKVNYYGTEAQFKMIDIGAGNDVVEQAFLYCADSDGK